VTKIKLSVSLCVFVRRFTFVSPRRPEIEIISDTHGTDSLMADVSVFECTLICVSMRFEVIVTTFASKVSNVFTTRSAFIVFEVTLSRGAYPGL
jgi:hypothetical protein